VGRAFGGAKGPANANWKGGKRFDERGYVRIRVDGKYKRQHRVNMEKAIGRKLKASEVVHHRDENRGNNAPENLELYADNSEHMRKHFKGRKRGRGLRWL